MGIDPDSQDRGLGTLLTSAGLHQLSDGGSTNVPLYEESHNPPARAVYAGLGFEHAETDTHVQYTRS